VRTCAHRRMLARPAISENGRARHHAARVAQRRGHGCHQSGSDRQRQPLGRDVQTPVCEEVVGVLDEVDEPLWHDQWPNDLDVPPEANDGAPKLVRELERLVDDSALASFAGWEMTSGPTFLRLRLEAEAEERAVAARAQLAAEAVVRDKEALRVMAAEAEVREAEALRAVEAENVRLAEEARRKIEGEAAVLAEVERRAAISARIADLPRRSNLSVTLARDFVKEHLRSTSSCCACAATRQATRRCTSTRPPTGASRSPTGAYVRRQPLRRVLELSERLGHGAGLGDGQGAGRDVLRVDLIVGGGSVHPSHLTVESGEVGLPERPGKVPAWVMPLALALARHLRAAALLGSVALDPIDR
jgi:hypothetical protein